MSYKGKMNAWGLDRALAAKQAGVLPEVDSYEKLINAGERFAEYAYEPESDLQELIGTIGDLLMKCEKPLELAEQIQRELDVFKEQIPLHLAKAN